MQLMKTIQFLVPAVACNYRLRFLSRFGVLKDLVSQGVSLML